MSEIWKVIERQRKEIDKNGSCLILSVELLAMFEALHEARDVLGYYSEVYPEPKGKEVYTKKATTWLAKWGQ